MKIFVKKFLLIVIIFNLLNIPVIAFQVKIESNINLRQKGSDGNFYHKSGRLKSGSIVEIPDKYQVKRHGVIDVERSINRWLRKGQITLNKFNGDKRDYFFPVKILNAKNGSKGVSNGQTKYIALDYLKRRHRLTLITTKDSIAVSKKDATTSIANPLYLSASDIFNTSYKSCRANPGLKEQDIPGFKSLQTDIANALNEITDESQNKNNQILRNRSYLVSKITKTCSPNYKFNKFTKELNKQIKKSKIPGLTTEIMMNLIHQESGGNCNAVSNEGATHSKSIGLFQVNTQSTNVPKCNSRQKRRLSLIKDTLIFKDQSLRCLENPIVNLQEALRIFKEKSKMLQARTIRTRYYGRLKGFSKKFMQTPESIKVLLSAYNGGQAWPIFAKQDLESFNKLHGSHYDPNKWKDLRIFYMRRYINKHNNNFQDRKNKEKLFGKKFSSKSGRTKRNSYINLKYVESITGITI